MHRTASIAAIASAFILSFTAFFALPSTAAAGSAIRTHKVTMIYLDIYRHGSWGIWAVRPNGKKLHQVANGFGAVVSPDGKRVWCRCANGIGVMKPDGSRLRKVAAGPTDFSNVISLSGVGTAASTDSGDTEIPGFNIEVENVDGSNLHTIYSGEVPDIHNGVAYTVSFGSVVISPDGSKVAFTKTEDSYAFCQAHHFYSGCLHTIESVNVINSDGSGLHTVQMVQDAAGNIFAVQLGAPHSFSADNSGLVLYGEQSGCYSAFGVEFAATDGEIQNAFCSLPHNGLQPFLSPDGTRFAFTAHANEGSSAGDGVFTAGLDGSGLHRIVPPYNREEVTSWAKVEVPQP